MKKLGKVVIHYQLKKSNPGDWALWLWEFPQGVGKEYAFNGKDDFGLTATYPLNKWSDFVLINNLGLIVKSAGTWDKKDGNDRVIKFYKMTPDEKGNYHVYLVEGDDELYSNAQFDKIVAFNYAKFTSFRTVEVKLNDVAVEYNLKSNGKILCEKKFDEPTLEFKIKLDDDIIVGNEYIIEVKLQKNNSHVHKRVRFYGLYDDKKFIKKFSYEGELGVICTDNSTLFKVWSPVSRKIILRVYKSGTPTYYDRKKGNDDIIYEEEMFKGENGVFSFKIDKNLHGYYYTYTVTNDTYYSREIVDVYAKSTGINGYRGMIVDFSKIDSVDLSKIKIHPYNARAMVVYEAHICDLTSSSTWTNDPKQRKYEKTFLGACLENTSYTLNGITVKTGFDHIRELGVHAVQLLPIFDQANDENNLKFNWGYNPANYNVLEGGYSTNPFDGSVRIKEFKYLIKKYHDAGINIIMDVVFNHVNGAVGSNFDVLMPGYYFRYVRDHVYANGSGCGNETASERFMYRKFMIDSVVFYAKEYKISGFRFDLMAIHDIDTMNELVHTLHDYDKNIVVYGEPWAACQICLDYDKIAIKDNANHFKDYGFFSDCMRDSLIRTTKNLSCGGWCINSISPSVDDQDRIVQGIKGTSYNVTDPNKIVNYASCHDNRTLIDRVNFDGIHDKQAKQVAMLANSIVLSANGIAFMLSGEEFLRSKCGSDNSYNAPFEVNALDYSLKVVNIGTFNNYKKLINLKQSVSDLSLDKKDNEKMKVNYSLPNLIHYELEDKETHRNYQVFHVNGYRTGKPIIVNLENYHLYLDTINSHKDLSNKTALIPYETLIAYK